MIKPRRMSIEGDFMNYRVNDLIYSFMRSLSTYNGDKEYLTKKNFQKEKKLIANICGITTQSINNNIKSMIKSGLLKEGKVNDYDCYFFPYDTSGKYKIIEADMLKYLVYTRSAHAIHIYLWLLDKEDFKEDYIFTIREIKKGLGYAETTKSADEVIKTCLYSLQKEGIIEIQKIWIEEVTKEGKVFPTERMVLKKVLRNPHELNGYKEFIKD